MRQERETSEPGEATALVGVVPPPTPPEEGDSERQFNDAFRRLQPRLITFAERLLDRETARDVVSQTFLELWRRWPRLRPEQRSDRYFFGAVRNQIADAREERYETVSLEDAEEELDRMVVAEHSPAWGDRRPSDVVDAALAAMTARRREVFMLVKEEGFTYAQVAEQLGISIATVNSYIVGGHELIRAAFARANVPLPTARIPRLPSKTGGASHD